MKITIDRQEFERSLFIGQNVAQSKGAMQILGYLHLSAEDDLLTLRATDLDLSIIIQCSAEVSEPGTLILQARTLYDLVRKGVNPSVTISTEENYQCRIDTGTNYSLVGLDPKEFPELPEAEGSSFLTLPAGTFVDAIKKTLYSTSDNEARIALNGVFIEPQNEGLRFVATDGHRLACTDVEECEGSFGATESGVILARKSLQELIKSLPDKEKTLSIGLYERFVLFRWDNVSCSLRLVDSEFPNYHQVIPDNLPYKTTFDRVALLESIDRVGAVANDRFSGLKFAFSKDALELSCNNFEQGESRDLMMITYDGDDTKIGFNIRYVQATLQSMTSKEISMRFRDQLSAAIFENEEEGVLAVIMPLRI